MEIKVRIELVGIPEAIKDLADAIRSIRGERVDNVVEIQPQKEKRASRKTKAADPVAEEKATPEESAAPDPEPVKIEEPQKPKAQYTLDQISYAGVDLMEHGHMDDLFALLEKYGIQSLTAAKPEQYNDIAADLIALGATIERS